jgi:hypothetical protein
MFSVTVTSVLVEEKDAGCSSGVPATLVMIAAADCRRQRTITGSMSQKGEGDARRSWTVMKSGGAARRDARSNCRLRSCRLLLLHRTMCENDT